MSAVPSVPAVIRRDPDRQQPARRSRLHIEDRELWPVRAPRREVSAREMRRAGRVS